MAAVSPAFAPMSIACRSGYTARRVSAIRPSAAPYRGVAAAHDFGEYAPSRNANPVTSDLNRLGKESPRAPENRMHHISISAYTGQANVSPVAFRVNGTGTEEAVRCRADQKASGTPCMEVERENHTSPRSSVSWNTIHKSNIKNQHFSAGKRTADRDEASAT